MGHACFLYQLKVLSIKRKLSFFPSSQKYFKTKKPLSLVANEC